MAYAKFDDFQKAVKKANWTFKESASSLAPLYAVLRGNPTTVTVRPLVDGIPAAKQQKYAKALALLDADFPAPPQPAAVAVGGSQPGAIVAQLAVQAAAVRQLRAPVNVAQIENANVIGAPLQSASFGYVAAPIPATNTEGYELILDPSPVTLVTPASRVGPLTAVQIARLNDSFRRVRRAVELAIAALQGLRADSRSFEKTQYSLYFGTYSSANSRTVLQNYQSIENTLSGSRGRRVGSLFLIDARNDVQKMNWFAAAYRGEAANGRVRMFIGRAFFQSVPRVSMAYYKSDTDFTVGTIIHELAHACFSASDVPTVSSGLALQPDGMPPPGADVCNEQVEDRKLAQANPAGAILNADNYNQFARALLQDEGG